MFCNNCGLKIDIDTPVCPACGAQLTTGEQTASQQTPQKRTPLIIAIIAACVVVLAAVIGIIYFASPSRRLQNALDGANGNVAGGHYDRAERGYELALSIDEGNLEAYKGLFDVCMGREDYDEIPDLYDDASDALSKSDLKEFDKYVSKTLESAIKKAIKHEDWDLGFELADVYEEVCDDPDGELLDDLDDLSHAASGSAVSASSGPAGSMDTPADPGSATPDVTIPDIDRDDLIAAYGLGYDEGQVIPDFTFYDASGKTYSISDFEGKTVYINFFTTWCTYCFYEIPDMQDIADEFDRDAVVIMIDLDEGPELGTQYAEDYDVDLPIYYVDGWELEGGLYLEAVPLSIVIDRYGVVYGNHLGQADHDWMYDAMEDAVNSDYSSVFR